MFLLARASQIDEPRSVGIGGVHHNLYRGVRAARHNEAASSVLIDWIYCVGRRTYS
jgi:hypothetical protein